MLRVVVCALLVLSSASSAWASGSPWNGTWKVNEAKSRYARRTFTISEKGGMLHLTNGGSSEYDFRCDGKEYTTSAKHTLSCRKNSERTYDFVSKASGEEISRSRRTLSRDGKTLTIRVAERAPDGSPYNLTQTWVRSVGTEGLLGTWTSVREVASPPRTMRISVAGDTFRQEYVSTLETYEGKLDGSSIVVTGLRVVPGTTTEMKAEGPRAISYVMKRNGKVTEIGREELRENGRVLVDTYWVPGEQQQKTYEVYEKQ